MRVSAKYLCLVAVSVIEATPHITEGLFSTAAVYLFFFWSYGTLDVKDVKRNATMSTSAWLFKSKSSEKMHIAGIYRAIIKKTNRQCYFSFSFIQTFVLA
jgi:hypothetical protein